MNQLARRPMPPRRVALAVTSIAALIAVCGSARAAEESMDSVVQRLWRSEDEKGAIFFNAARTPAQVDRLVAMFAPEFRSINLAPGGVTQTGYADLRPQLAGVPTMPYALTDKRTVRINDSSVVLNYRGTITPPGAGPVSYLASSVWARRADGSWRTVFYQATPLP